MFWGFRSRWTMSFDTIAPMAPAAKLGVWVSNMDGVGAIIYNMTDETSDSLQFMRELHPVNLPPFTPFVPGRHSQKCQMMISYFLSIFTCVRAISTQVKILPTTALPNIHDHDTQPNNINTYCTIVCVAIYYATAAAD